MNAWMTGPVAVTGAGGHVGRAVVRRLAGLPNPVLPLGREDDWAAAIAEAEAVIHLAGALQPRRHSTHRQANLIPTVRCVQAVRQSPVRRVVYLSYVGADPRSANQYLASKGQAEKLIRGLRLPTVVLRSTYVYGDREDIGPSFVSYQVEPGSRVSMIGDGSQRLAPIHVDDLSGILVAAALDTGAPTGTFDLSGPDTLTLDEFVGRLNPHAPRIRHIPAPLAGLLGRVSPGLTPELVGVLLADSLAESDPQETASRFGVSLRPTRETVATGSAG